jgi:hypothetical protein
MNRTFIALPPPDLTLAEKGSLLMTNSKTMDFFHGGTLHGTKEQIINARLDKNAKYTLQVRNKHVHHKIDVKLKIVPMGKDPNEFLPVAQGKSPPKNKFVYDFDGKQDEPKDLYVEVKLTFLGFVADYEIELYCYEKRTVAVPRQNSNGSPEEDSHASPVDNDYDITRE